MGAYLSSPITEKVSSDTSGETLICGASSMQGWRMTQEDAHNCIVDYNGAGSLFAVYDGHGGKDVAEYTAQHLPNFIKECEAYKNGDYEKALKDAFVKFDSTLKEPEVLAILKTLAGVKKDDDESEDENLGNLKEEANMPIEEVMAKYTSGGVIANCSLMNLKNESKKGAPLSPFLRGRKVKEFGGSSSSDQGGCSSSTANEIISSKSDVNGDVNVGEVDSCNSVDSSQNTVSNSNISVCSDNLPDSSQDNNKLVNGESTNHSESNKQQEDVSSSVENGKLKGKGKQIMKKQPKIKEKISQTPEQLFQKFVHADAASGSSSDSESEDATFQGFDVSSDDENDGVKEDNEAACVGSATEGEAELSNEDEEEGDDDDDDEDEDDSDESDPEDEDDEFTMNMTDEPGYDSGCTAVVALVKGDKIYVANAGDSRCVVCKKGEAVEMSFDHKPEDEPETNRIVKAGGKVTCDGRVNGGLNLSRALGDHVYKQTENLSPEEQMISPLPDVKVLDVDRDVEFMVLACDGIWNFMSSKEVVDFVRPKLREKRDKISTICEELFDHCLAPDTLGDGTGCDNMTAVIVQFKNYVQDEEEEKLTTTTETENKRPVVVEECKKRPADGDDATDDNNKRQKTDITSTTTDCHESDHV